MSTVLHCFDADFNGELDSKRSLRAFPPLLVRYFFGAEIDSMASCGVIENKNTNRLSRLAREMARGFDNCSGVIVLSIGSHEVLFIFFF
jgi:hypothetical protein